MERCEALGPDAGNVEELVYAAKAAALLAHLPVAVGYNVLGKDGANAWEGFKLRRGGGVQGDATRRASGGGSGARNGRMDSRLGGRAGDVDRCLSGAFGFVWSGEEDGLVLGGAGGTLSAGVGENPCSGKEQGEEAEERDLLGTR